MLGELKPYARVLACTHIAHQECLRRHCEAQVRRNEEAGNNNGPSCPYCRTPIDARKVFDSKFNKKNWLRKKFRKLKICLFFSVGATVLHLLNHRLGTRVGQKAEDDDHQHFQNP